MAMKKKDISMFEDGDSAHWVDSKRKTKRVTPSDANSSAKYDGKKTISKKSTKKIVTTKR